MITAILLVAVCLVAIIFTSNQENARIMYFPLEQQSKIAQASEKQAMVSDTPEEPVPNDNVVDELPAEDVSDIPTFEEDFDFSDDVAVVVQAKPTPPPRPVSRPVQSADNLADLQSAVKQRDPNARAQQLSDKYHNKFNL